MIRTIDKVMILIGSGTLDLPACSLVPCAQISKENALHSFPVATISLRLIYPNGGVNMMDTLNMAG
jgi:hypothetical protein